MALAVGGVATAEAVGWPSWRRSHTNRVALVVDAGAQGVTPDARSRDQVVTVRPITQLGAVAAGGQDVAAADRAEQLELRGGNA